MRLLRYAADRVGIADDGVEFALPGAIRAIQTSNQVTIGCRHQDTLWSMTEAEVQRFGASGFASMPLHDKQGPDPAIDCRGETALVLRRLPDVVERCTGDHCRVVFEARHHERGGAALFDNGTWIYAAALGRVVGVWREGGAAPAFYQLEDGDELKGVTVLNNTAYFVVVNAGLYRVRPIPPAA